MTIISDSWKVVQLTGNRALIILCDNILHSWPKRIVIARWFTRCRPIGVKRMTDENEHVKLPAAFFHPQGFSVNINIQRRYSHVFIICVCVCNILKSDSRVYCIWLGVFNKPARKGGAIFYKTNLNNILFWHGPGDLCVVPSPRVEWVRYFKSTSKRCRRSGRGRFPLRPLPSATTPIQQKHLHTRPGGGGWGLKYTYYYFISVNTLF